MSGWLYVLELSPTGCVKVGRTDDLVQRLALHLNASTTYGVSVTRIASFVVDDAARDEARLLSALRRNRKARVYLGRETFTGISFDEVLRLVDDVLRAPSPDTVPSADVCAVVRPIVEPEPEPDDPDLLTALAAVLGGPRERLGDVLTRMRKYDWDRYGSWTQKRLARELESAWGVRTGLHNGYRVLAAADIENARQNGGYSDDPEQTDAG